jgi:hypothetical protein
MGDDSALIASSAETLYHFTDEQSVQRIKVEGFVGHDGRSSFYSTWPSDDLMPQGRSDCTWVVIVDIPSDQVERDPFNPDICTVPDEVLSACVHNFRYEAVSPEQRLEWGFP